MDIRIQTILADLYELDPALRAHDAELRKLAQAVLASKPDVKLDGKFAGRLRERLLSCARELQAIQHTKQEIHQPAFMKFKLYYLAGAAVLAVLIVVPAVFLSQKGIRQTVPTFLSPGRDAGGVVALAPGSFGPLSLGGGAQAAPQGLGAGYAGSSLRATEESAVAPVAGDSAKALPGFGGGGGVAMPSPTIIYPPDFTSYRYVYRGEELSLTGGTVDVLRRVKSGSRLELGQFAGSFGMSGIDFSGFTDSTLQNFNFVQDKPYGYTVYVSLTEGTVSISENWEKWYACSGGVCPEVQPLRLDQVPSDDELIRLADAFLAEHKIDRTQYGSPEVSNEWRIWYERTGDPASLYVPDVMTVVYPLLLNTEAVVDDGGMKAGLRVNVNIRLKRVSGVWDLSTQRYEASAYEAESDTAKILSVAERGGVYGVLPEGGTVVDIVLETPTTAYLRFWNYRSGISEELFVPALVFPVVQPESDPNFYRASVIIPLAKELLNAPSGGPIIMPLETK